MLTHKRTVIWRLLDALRPPTTLKSISSLPLTKKTSHLASVETNWQPRHLIYLMSNIQEIIRTMAKFPIFLPTNLRRLNERQLHRTSQATTTGATTGFLRAFQATKESLRHLPAVACQNCSRISSSRGWACQSSLSNSHLIQCHRTLMARSQSTSVQK